MSASLTAKSGSIVNLLGGLTYDADSYVSYSLQADAGSEVHLFGYYFRLNGEEIDGLIPGRTLTLTARSVSLSGRLADDSPFRIYLQGDSSFHDDALLTITSLSYGDYNNDGVVDAADYVVIRQGMGSLYTANDVNFWRANFGKNYAGDWELRPPSVPEPNGLVGLMLVAAVLQARLRRRSIS